MSVGGRELWKWDVCEGGKRRLWKLRHYVLWVGGHDKKFVETVGLVSGGWSVPGLGQRE